MTKEFIKKKLGVSECESCGGLFKTERRRKYMEQCKRCGNSLVNNWGGHLLYCFSCLKFFKELITR
jgi:protein-arginine kinase activator protein McsA